MDELAAISKQFAVGAIEKAKDEGGDSDGIQEAKNLLDEGDGKRDLKGFKQAVAKYKDALAKAESTP